MLPTLKIASDWIAEPDEASLWQLETKVLPKT